jgi:hypothetical protein
MLQTDRAAIIDEYGELSRKVREFKPTADRAAALGKTIAAWYDDKPAEDAFTASGELFTVQVSARAQKRFVSNVFRLSRILGKRFYELATIKLEDIDKFVAPELHPNFISASRAGNRRVEAVAKGAAARAA